VVLPARGFVGTGKKSPREVLGKFMGHQYIFAHSHTLKTSRFELKKIIKITKHLVPRVKIKPLLPLFVGHLFFFFFFFFFIFSGTNA
jgi:hypothetical protein